LEIVAVLQNADPREFANGDSLPNFHEFEVCHTGSCPEVAFHGLHPRTGSLFRIGLDGCTVVSKRHGPPIAIEAGLAVTVLMAVLVPLRPGDIPGKDINATNKAGTKQTRATQLRY
jgi:hypothetical protein